MLPGTASVAPPSPGGEDQLLSAAPAPGTVIAGKYRVERALGAGGMGVVVAAYHLQLDTEVAIKFLLNGAVTGSEASARFEREARAAVKITNEHVARVFDVGTLETGAPYIVMEFLRGVDLATLLRNQGRLAIEPALECVLQACEALAEAHALGIVHRDLKPANLFCVRRPDDLPWVKVLDFGISKVQTKGQSSRQIAMTDSAAIMGSPLYMSPEQMQSTRSVDSRTDIWSLGVILYELLTGQSPFYAEGLPEVCINIAVRPPPDLRQLRPDCPAPLERAILRCLEKEPAARFADVGELALALAPFGPARAQASVERITRTAHAGGRADTLVAHGGPPVPFSSTPGSGPVQTSTALGHTKRGQGGRPSTVAVAAIVGTIAVLLFASFVYVSMRREPAAPTGRAISSASSGAPAAPVSAPAFAPASSIAAPAEPPAAVVPPEAAAAPPATTHEAPAAKAPSPVSVQPPPLHPTNKPPGARPPPPLNTAPKHEDIY